MLTREQIEKLRAHSVDGASFDSTSWTDRPFWESAADLCDMALASLTARESGFADAVEQAAKVEIDPDHFDRWYDSESPRWHSLQYGRRDMMVAAFYEAHRVMRQAIRALTPTAPSQSAHCPDCDGNGMRMRPGTADDAITCPSCNGSGFQSPIQSESADRVMVPREPTEEMIVDAVSAVMWDSDMSDGDIRELILTVWKTMIPTSERGHEK